MSKREDVAGILRSVASINTGDWFDMDIFIDEILDALGVEIVVTEEVRKK